MSVMYTYLCSFFQLEKYTSFIMKSSLLNSLVFWWGFFFWCLIFFFFLKAYFYKKSVKTFSFVLAGCQKQLNHAHFPKFPTQFLLSMIRICFVVKYQKLRGYIKKKYYVCNYVFDIFSAGYEIFLNMLL